VNPDDSNPYVPWNPIGAIIGPLALFSLVARRRKSKANPYLLMLLMLVVLPLSVGMACNGGGTSTPLAPATTLSPTALPPATATNIIPTVTQAPADPAEPCANCASEPTPTPTPIVIEDYITFEGWTDPQKDVAMEAIRKVNEKLLGDASLLKFLQVYNISTSTPLQFIKMNDTGENGCASGPHLIKCHTDYDFDDPRLIVHELGHVLHQNNLARNLYGDLLISENAIVDDTRIWVTGLHPRGDECRDNTDPNSSLGIRCAATTVNQYGSFERTFFGYTGDRIPDVYHGRDFGDWNTANEDFADMFMNWAYNSFDYRADANNAGTKRYDWMDERMAPFIG
jgi:hypothetical protein